MSKNYKLNRIKKNYSYLIGEICELLGVSKNTVFIWIKKEGLKTVDSHKPFLVHGSDLKEFLQKKQSSRRFECKTDELPCLECHAPKQAWEGMVDVFVGSEVKMNLQGLCITCGSKMNKRFKRKNFDLIKKNFDVQQVHNSHLIESSN